MATATTRPITFGEFEQLPEPREGYRLELRHGEPFQVAPPKIDHTRVQWQIRRLLERATAGAGIVDKEIGFRIGENDYRIADVAFISQSRWDSAQDYLIGAPELVIEVLSASNTAAEMLEKEQICLANGCQEFWVVDPDLRIVKVMTPDGRGITHQSGQEIPLPLLNNARVSVDAIFAPLAEPK